jgi:hypothetical protein
MSKARLIHELNEVLRTDYRVEQSIDDPLTVRDLAIIVQALKQGKEKKRS